MRVNTHLENMIMQGIQKPKPGVMPGLAVFGTRVTEANDQE
jgi:hypothetical protein